MSHPKPRIDLQRTMQQGFGDGKVFAREAVQMPPAARVQMPGIETARRRDAGTFDDRMPDDRFERSDDVIGQFVLDLEQILQGTLVALRPEVMTGSRIDQLAGHAHSVAGLANAAFEHVAGAQAAADLLDIDRAPLGRRSSSCAR